MNTAKVLTQGTVTRVSVSALADVVDARRCGRSMAMAARFTPSDVAVVAGAVSELARNIVLHAKRGEIAIGLVENGQLLGVRIVASDRGPGLFELDRTTLVGASTGGRLGLGLSAVKEIVDEFQIDSTPSGGTRIVVTKWGL